jgi:hypothetical protein
MKIKLSDILAVNGNPDASYVLDECELTPAERESWEAKRAASNAAIQANRTPAISPEFEKVQADRLRKPYTGPRYEYPKGAWDPPSGSTNEEK